MEADFCVVAGRGLSNCVAVRCVVASFLRVLQCFSRPPAIKKTAPLPPIPSFLGGGVFPYIGRHTR